MHVSLDAGAEAQHAAEELKRAIEARTVVILAHFHVPATAKRDDSPVQVPDLLSALVIESVVLADADPVAPQPVEARPLLIEDKEGVVLGDERPFAGGTLDIDDLLMAGKV